MTTPPSTRLRTGKHWKNAVFLLLAAALPAVAQVAQDEEMEITGFRVPEYDEEGIMTSQLFGDRAVMQGGGKVKIDGVSMDFYRDGEVFMKVKSPYCFFNQKTNEARSDAPLEADMEGVRVRGRGYILKSNKRTVQIHEDSQVVIDESMSGNSAVTNQATVISSIKLFMDYSARKVRFEENVHVDDPQLSMDCDIMNVGFSEDNQIEWIEALSNVHIEEPQMTMDCDKMNVRFNESGEINWIEALTEVKIFSEGREAYAGRAEYDVATGEILLEESPKVLEGRNMLIGDRIRFWRASGRMTCEPSARLIIYPDDNVDTDIFGN